MRKIIISLCNCLIAFIFASSCDYSINQVNTSRQITIDDTIIVVELPTTSIIVDTKCPSNMVYVEGDWCSDLVEPCLSWADKKEVDKWNDEHPDAKKSREYNMCEHFVYPTVCKSKKLKHLSFCMDKYEASGKDGLPIVMVNYYDVEKACTANGKRMCKDYEFEKACEGNENKPYPYGYDRDDTACNANKNYIDYDEEKIAHHDPDELKKVDQRAPSGSYPRCKSDYGVYDIVGNADEMYRNSVGIPYKDSLMGGHWMHGARNRCRAARISHNEYFELYEVGYRCCFDIK